MLTKNQFLEMCGIEKLQLFKGKGREFATTPIGKVFAAEGIKWNEPVFVSEHDGKPTKDGKDCTHLKGTFWFVNAAAKASTVVTKD